MNAAFNLVMEKQIEKKLPTQTQLFESRGGFALGILRLSSSDMARLCNKFTFEFLFGTNTEGEQTTDALRHVYIADDEKLKGLKAAILKEKYKKNDTTFRGEKKIVIFTADQDQMKSFEDLGDFATNWRDIDIGAFRTVQCSSSRSLAEFVDGEAVTNTHVRTPTL